MSEKEFDKFAEIAKDSAKNSLTKQVPLISKFQPDAQAKLSEHVGEFMADMMRLSLQKLEPEETVVHVAHVRSANEELRPKKQSKSLKVVGTLGGLLAGVGIGLLGSSLFIQSIIPHTQLWSGLVLAIGGSVLLTVHLSKN